MDEDIKVGDIVYWYAENDTLREYVFRRWPYLIDGYGVVTRVDRFSMKIKYPERDRSFCFLNEGIHKVELE